LGERGKVAVGFGVKELLAVILAGQENGGDAGTGSEGITPGGGSVVVLLCVDDHFARTRRERQMLMDESALGWGEVGLTNQGESQGGAGLGLR
jgi:hypothetical protein